MNKIIIPTGYMGSGSSAITNLISEVRGYEKNNGSFEYILMHCPDGVFDLEDKLLIGNNIFRSDEAIHRFISCMNDLYDKNNYWVSGYKKLISEHFLDYCNEFIENLEPIYMNDVYWYYQQNPFGIRMKSKNIIRRILGKISAGKIKIKRAIRYDKMIVTIPNKEKFYFAAKIFLNCIFSDLGYKSQNLILDQFLLPQNLFRLNRYFDNNVRVFVVERDPRDIFILNKYFWKPRGVAIPYPTDAKKFCKMYRSIRESEKIVEDSKIFRVYFEDLIFRYEEVVEKILIHIGCSADDHASLKRNKFDPDISINNTMLFKCNKYRTEEILLIENELYQYLYNFPKNINLNINLKTIF